MEKKLYLPILLIVAAEVLSLIIAYSPDPNETKEQLDSLKMTALKSIPSAIIAIGGTMTFVIAYYVEEGKEKKAKLKKHYEENLRNVLLQWQGTAIYAQVYLGERKAASICLYVNIMHQLNEHDNHHEVLPHLQTGYDEEKIMSLYLQLENEEKEHNMKAILFNAELEKIDESVTSITSLRLFDREMRRTRYYNFEHIMRYMVESAKPEWDKHEPLQITAYDQDCYKLFHRRIDDIAQGKEADVIALKKYLESEDVISKINQIKEFNEGVGKVSEIKKKFDIEIENLIHEADRSGFKGSCAFEENLDKKKVRELSKNRLLRF